MAEDDRGSGTVPGAGQIAARIDAMLGEIAAIRARVEMYGRALQIRDAVLAPSPAEAALSAPRTTPDAAPDPDENRLPRRHTAQAAEALRWSDGFHILEWGGDGPFRWTGPGHDARFQVWIDRSLPLRARITLARIGDPANEDALDLIVDGTAYPLRRDGGGQVFTAGPIPPRDGDRATEIRLHVPHLWWPRGDGGTDDRRLGVAFQRLLIEPA